MSETKHTPGPWVFAHRDGDHPLNDQNGWGSNGLWAVNGGLILGSGPGWDTPYQGPSEANARLIAAAPELLEALERLLGGWQSDTDTLNKAVDFAHAAIAKAKGGQP